MKYQLIALGVEGLIHGAAVLDLFFVSQRPGRQSGTDEKGSTGRMEMEAEEVALKTLAPWRRAAASRWAVPRTLTASGKP